MANRNRSHISAFLSVLLLFAAASLQAQSVTYNFSQFLPGQPTPLVNAAPDVGSSSFRADFTSAPNAAGFAITPLQANGLFSGNSLGEPLFNTGNVLTVTLNTAV